MKNNSSPKIEPSKIGAMMQEFGFRPEASTSTARALILNLVRSAYGSEAARECMRQMNLDQNRAAEAAEVETQLSLFEPEQNLPGTFLQKKSRPA